MRVVTNTSERGRKLKVWVEQRGKGMGVLRHLAGEFDLPVGDWDGVMKVRADALALAESIRRGGAARIRINMDDPRIVAELRRVRR